jgi:hypothetical protein
MSWFTSIWIVVGFVGFVIGILFVILVLSDR